MLLRPYSRWGRWKENWLHALKMLRCCAAVAPLLRRLTQAVLDSGVVAQHEVQMQYLDQIRDFD